MGLNGHLKGFVSDFLALVNVPAPALDPLGAFSRPLNENASQLQGHRWGLRRSRYEFGETWRVLRGRTYTRALGHILRALRGLQEPLEARLTLRHNT